MSPMTGEASAAYMRVMFHAAAHGVGVNERAVRRDARAAAAGNRAAAVRLRLATRLRPVAPPSIRPRCHRPGRLPRGNARRTRCTARRGPPRIERGSR